MVARAGKALDQAKLKGKLAEASSALADAKLALIEAQLRRILGPMGPVDSMEFLLDKLKHSQSNADFFEAMNQ